MLLGCIWFAQKIHLRAKKKVIEKERGTNLRVVLKENYNMEHFICRRTKTLICWIFQRKIRTLMDLIIRIVDSQLALYEMQYFKLSRVRPVFLYRS